MHVANAGNWRNHKGVIPWLRALLPKTNRRIAVNEERLVGLYQIHRTSMCAIAVAAVAALAVPTAVGAATINAPVNAKFLKTLTLTAKQNFDFGSVLLPSSGSAVTLSISRTGVLTCPAPLACTGTARHGIFNLSGSNAQVVRITALSVPMTNGTGGTLTFVPDAPATITLTNSGSPGTDFGVGGSISVSSTTPDGTYSGTVAITAEYQ
jgi:hypothetical protein